MKTFTNIALKIAGILASIGAVCLLIALPMGLTSEKFEEMFKNGKFSIEINGEDIDFFGNKKEVSYTMGVEVEESTIDIKEECTKLDVEFGAGKLEVYYDEDATNISIQQKNVVGYDVSTEDDGTLHIQGGLDVDDATLNGDNDATLTIIIPEGMSFDEINIEIGASQANIEDLVARKMSISVGAGQANFDNFNVKSLDLEVGAGEANVTNLIVENLDVEVGLGEVNVDINGKESNYNFGVECGIGRVQIEDYIYEGVGAEHHNDHSGAKYYIDIECGIGEVVVTFMK